MNRREFLKLSGAGGLAALNAGAIAAALAQAQPGDFAPQTTGGRDPVAHLINRLTFGVTPELYEYVSSMGVNNYIEEQLAPETIDDGETDRLLELFPLINQQGGALIADDQNRGQVFRDLFGATLVRAVYSRRQLYERMVQFWSDHFHVFIRGGGPVLYFKLDDDRDAIRPNALTTFRQILGASAHSPAMLFYLDNVQSRAEAPNENYGRELLELHTLGVRGGYSETDVKEVARAFTGWSITARREGEMPGLFRFRPRIHDRDEKIVLGRVLPAGRGIEDGEETLDILASHPSAARFISVKLVRRFVADTPPESLVTACADTFLQTGGDIKSLLRTIFASEEFWNAPPRFKRPFEYMISLIRALDYEVRRAQAFGRILLASLETMGHIPFDWPVPNGYPDTGAYWMGNLLPRWNAAVWLVLEGEGGRPDYAKLNAMLDTNDAESDLAAALDVYGRYLYGRALSDAELAIARDFAIQTDDALQNQQLAGLALLMAAPAFQYF